VNEDGFAHGNADGLFRIRDQIRTFDPEVLFVLSADHVYRFDFAEAVRTHRQTEAECTVVTTEVTQDEAADHATVEHDDDGRVTRFTYKPDEPTTTTVATEIFLYDPVVLIEVLEELHRELTADSEDGDTGLGDFGEHLVPRLVERGRVVTHELPGYWRDLGQPHLYLQAHQDVLVDGVGVLDQPGWPILTLQPQRSAARLLDGAEVVDSMVSPGSRVAGSVIRSVLGPGVVVERGATVRDSVVFADSVVEAGARVDWTVVDSGCVIGADAVVSGPDADGSGDPDQVTLIGCGSTVGAGVRIDVGARLEPGTTA